MGDIQHGMNIINEFSKVCKKYSKFNYAFKFQYRNLDTFIHKDFKNRQDLHYIKRFSETKLSVNDFDLMIKKIKDNGFYVMVTAFDNESLNVLKNQDVDFLKIASCSFTDWPLLEDAVETNLPIVASTAGASIVDIENVSSFFTNRKVDFALMHCIAEYPTKDVNMNMGQIDFLKNKFPEVPIGFSTHENPDSTDFVKIAIAKHAQIFEKHIALPTSEYKQNNYSANLIQFEAWLNSANYALTICGNSSRRKNSSKKEKDSLNSLKRGMFAKRNIKKGEILNSSNIYFSFPRLQTQLSASDFSKHNEITAEKNIQKDHQISLSNSIVINKRSQIQIITNEIRKILVNSSIVLPNSIPMEISHHYGIDKFDEYGMAIFTLINRGYCKKLLILLPGQYHPEQYHKRKEETFRLVYGDVNLVLDGKKHDLELGDTVTIEKNIIHSFKSTKGCVIEEISNTHFTDDSYYVDDAINKNENRKTIINYYP